MKSQTWAELKILTLKKFNFKWWNCGKILIKKLTKEKKSTKTKEIKFDRKKPKEDEIC
jgi:hypothetical protein